MLSEIIAKLPQLGQQDLQTLKATIDQLLHKQDKEAEPMLYDVLRRVLGNVQPYSVFRGTQAYKKWRRHAEYAQTFIDKNFPEANRVQRMALMTFVVQALVRDLKARDVPITVGTLVNNL